MTYYECRVAQSGFVAAEAFVVTRADGSVYKTAGIDAEILRFENAVKQLENQISDSIEKSAEETKALLEVEKMLLRDEGFYGYVVELIIKHQKSAVNAVIEAEDKLCNQLLMSGDEYISSRCDDIKGLIASLVSILTGSEIALPTSPCIIVADELSPLEISLISANNILGIITSSGSNLSHVSILAGNMNIPYLYGLNNITELIKTNDFVIIDSDSKSICINPDEAIRKQAINKYMSACKQRLEESVDSYSTKTPVYANITGPDDIDEVIRMGASGIGLFRSEFLFLDKTIEPSEEEQYEAYKSVVSKMGDKEVIIRTMDIGSDKKVRWLDMKDENNPISGLRGIRLSLVKREIFRTQLRAILRAGIYGNLKVMLPMVTSLWEVEEALKELNIAIDELKMRGDEYKVPQLGVMIETPAAVMIAERLAEKVNFFSIGSNDLTQYTLALDREIVGLDDYYNPLHEAIFSMIELTVNAAHKYNIPVAVCGEIAAKTEALERLLATGIDKVSVSTSKIPSVKAMICNLENKL